MALLDGGAKTRTRAYGRLDPALKSTQSCHLPPGREPEAGVQGWGWGQGQSPLLFHP